MTDERVFSFKKVIEDSIEATSKQHPERPRGYQNIIIAIEELSELTKELTKALRGKPNKEQMVEELADVTFVTEYIKTIFEISDLDITKAMTMKARRVMDTLSIYGQYE